jgi:hypothetical protein
MWNPKIYLSVRTSKYLIAGVKKSCEALCISVIPETMGGAQCNAYEGLRLAQMP